VDIPVSPMPAIAEAGFTVMTWEPVWVPFVKVAVKSADSASKSLTLSTLAPSTNPLAKVTAELPAPQVPGSG